MRFPELDGLRGLAALGVAIFHYLIGPAQKLPFLDRIISMTGMSPVSIDTFFILSGFLIGGILLRLKQSPDYYKVFYLRRATRILPLYYVWLIFYCFLFLMSRSAPPQGISRTFYLSSFFLFIQSFYPAIIVSSYMVVPTWSLVAEEHFYLVVPICIRRLTSRGLVLLLVSILIAAPLFRLFLVIGWPAQWADMAVYYWAPCHADALAMGVLLALIWRSPRSRTWLQNHVSLSPWGMLIGSGLAILLSEMANAHLRYVRLLDASIGRTFQEFASLGLIVYLICWPDNALGRVLSSNVMRRLGKISYCIYMVHWGILWMIFRFVLHTRIGASLLLDFMVAPVALLLTVVVAQLSWIYFERPLLRWVHGSRKPAHAEAMPRPATTGGLMPSLLDQH